MGRFGTILLGTFLDRAWPERDENRLHFVKWAEVTELFFNSANDVRLEAEKHGHVWSETAITELDNALLAAAESGAFSGIVSVSPEATEELWRRWSYAIMASKLEERFGRELNIAIPADAPPAVQGMAVVLYILGGPARAYRRELFEKKPPH